MQAHHVQPGIKGLPQHILALRFHQLEQESQMVLQLSQYLHGHKQPSLQVQQKCFQDLQFYQLLE